MASDSTKQRPEVATAHLAECDSHSIGRSSFVYSRLDKASFSSTGSTRGSLSETTGYIYSKPFYGCIQSITVTKETKLEIKETVVDFLEDAIGGSVVVGSQACSVITTRTTTTDM